MAKKQRITGKRISPKSAGTSQPPQVDFSRNELLNLLPIYYMIRDVIDGEPAIKGLIGNATNIMAGSGNGGLPMTMTNIILTRAARYLPQPNAEDKSAANLERYRAYVTRAVFYGVTGRTLEGMAGQIFLRDPVVNIPAELDLLKIDADGGGLTLDQTAYRLVRHCVAYGRSGVLIDYPSGTAPATKKDIAEGDIRPTFTTYNPWDIINWRIETKGGKRRLTLLVLRESREEEGYDGFQLNSYEQYRVLKIDSDTGNHVVELYRKGDVEWAVEETFNPTDAKGKPLTEIPFHFVGSEDNTEVPNKPPLYDLSALNIAHYRNSADYEEACFIVGQPTPVLTGISQDWYENVLLKTVTLGARAAIPLPVGANATLLQAAANSMPIEAMNHKEEQMVSLGAKLVKLQKTAKTATQQIIETTSESSTLANIAKNVSEAMEWGLKIAAQFVGASVDAIEYTLNKDFDLTSMTADDQNAVIKQWQSAAIGFSEMRTVLRRAGTASMDDDAARKAIAQDIADGLIPDPALEQNPPPLPAAPSGAGGPQPKRIRRQGSPGVTG